MSDFVASVTLADMNRVLIEKGEINEQEICFDYHPFH